MTCIRFCKDELKKSEDKKQQQKCDANIQRKQQKNNLYDWNVHMKMYDNVLMKEK